MFGVEQNFTDRRDAGRQLAMALDRFRSDDPLVLALPRGGVPVAYEVARALNASLDVVLVRKIGAPGYPELGIGAVVDGADPQLVLNEDVLRMVRPDEDYIDAEKQRQLEEIERRRQLYRKGRPAEPVDGRTVIVVDDGIATGGTVRAVLKALKRAGAARLVLAIPVAPAEALDTLRADVDEVICLATPEPFHAVGVHYTDFEQTEDSEVTALLGKAPHSRPAPPAG